MNKWLKISQNCLLCDEPCGPGLPLCTACELELPWLGHRCETCALPLAAPGLVCGECLRRPPAFDRVEVALRYAFPVDSLVQAFKHRARWPLGRLLGQLLARHLRHAYDEGLARPDLLLPVPLAAARLRRRGFNQSAMLADWLARDLHLAQAPHLLARPVDTAAQQSLDAAARRRNLRQAFALGGGLAVPPHVALVDDVMTTGATAEALARLLKRGGAQRVDLYCLARTPRPGD